MKSALPRVMSAARAMCCPPGWTSLLSKSAVSLKRRVSHSHMDAVQDVIPIEVGKESIEIKVVALQCDSILVDSKLIFRHVDKAWPERLQGMVGTEFEDGW